MKNWFLNSFGVNNTVALCMCVYLTQCLAVAFGQSLCLTCHLRMLSNKKCAELHLFFGLIDTIKAVSMLILSSVKRCNAT